MSYLNFPVSEYFRWAISCMVRSNRVQEELVKVKTRIKFFDMKDFFSLYSYDPPILYFWNQKYLQPICSMMNIIPYNHNRTFASLSILWPLLMSI